MCSRTSAGGALVAAPLVAAGSRKPSTLLVSLVALPRLRDRLGLGPAILGQRAPDINHILKAALVVATDVPLVSAHIDQLTFTTGHDALRGLGLADGKRVEGFCGFLVLARDRPGCGKWLDGSRFRELQAV